MFLMNHILGNRDRNSFNFLHSKSSRGGIKLIDHGLTFADQSSARVPTLPSYMRSLEDVIPSASPVHPVAQQWLHSLDPVKFVQHLEANGVPEKAKTAALDRLTNARALLRSDPNHSRMALMLSSEA
jgi:hypothetical protein